MRYFDSAPEAEARDPGPRAANLTPLTPIDFLERAADVQPDKIAIVDGDTSHSYAQFRSRSRRLAGALVARGIGTGDVVSILCPNSHHMLEAHFGVPIAGAILNALNIRLDAAGIAAILRHAGSRVLLVHASLLPLAEAALEQIEASVPLVVLGGEPGLDDDYEAILGAAVEHAGRPGDEWDTIALNYTSGTTGSPKGVLYSHRGACLNALGNIITFGLSPSSVYLWTLPMFHCNGWSFPWALTGIGGRHICLPKVEPREIFRLIEEERVTHLCAAPVVLTMLIEQAPAGLRGFDHGIVEIATGGAAPPSSVIESIERLGFRVTHLYGLTESYGPSTSCVPKDEWADLPLPERSRLMARQGVRNITMAEQQVLKDGEPVAADGVSIGELVLRGNTIMKGYFKAAQETDAALDGGWLHTGDLAVVHPDGYVEIKDRAKDVIISGGENISSLEVEEVLYRHPAIGEAAVVAAPDAKWGETPVAFVRLTDGGSSLTSAQVIDFCRQHLARFKCPTSVIFGELPKTATGKVEKFVLRDRAAAASAQEA